VLAVSLILAFLVVRLALFQFYAGKDPARIARIWPGHPLVILESGLAEIGDRAAAGQPVDRALVHRLLAASARAPLAPEPFLVRGVEAQLAGDQRMAQQAFLAARERSPRNIASRYFLADHYLKASQTGPGLTEISVLARLVPESLPSMAPFLASFAQSPGAAPKVKGVLRGHPQLEPVLLNSLSTDAANTDLILSLWSGRGGEEARIWQNNLLAQLVESGRYDLARQTWARFTGIAVEPGKLFDPEFGRQAMPPFGWNFASGPAGVAESEGNGRLHILFYGRDNAVLASQLLTLKPGRYGMSMKVDTSGSPSKSLQWTVSCLPAASQIAAMSLDRAGSISGSFTVPPDCRAQRLELRGTSPEFPEQSDVTISQFSLEAGQ
jgi:hypothetical protein